MPMKELDFVRLLHLHPNDNVAVLAQDGQKGASAKLLETELKLPCDLSMGHKLAIGPIGKGTEILKYGAPIGTASCEIAQGDHVHLHNIKSQYTVIEDMEAGQT